MIETRLIVQTGAEPTNISDTARLTASEAVKPVILSTREGYDRWAAIYDSDGNPLVALEEPWMDRLLGDVRGLAVLDVGCGTGNPNKTRRA